MCPETYSLILLAGITNPDKAGIVSALCSRIGCNKEDGQVIVDMILGTIKGKIEQGEMVKLSGFGNLSVHSKRSRVGQNPKTGEAVEVTARRVLTLKPSIILRDRVKDEAGNG